MSGLQNEAHLTTLTWEYAQQIGFHIEHKEWNFKALFRENVRLTNLIDPQYPDEYLIAQAIEFGMLPHYAQIYGETAIERILLANK